jgi:SAM-dependent methyltransferase
MINNIPFYLLSFIILLSYIKKSKKPKKITAGVIDVNSSLKTLEEIYSDKSLYGFHHDKYDTTYGEIMCNSIDNIFNNITFNKNDVVYDLGSGGGKLLIYIYLKYKLDCIGIEIIEHRHNKAIEIFKKYKNNKQKNILKFLYDDFFNISFSKGTIFYICNTMWDDHMNNKILNKILKESNMKYVILAKPCDHDKLKLYKTITVDWSWNKNSNLYIYIPV